MKIKELDYYVKFIFSSREDNVCFSTTDREFLKNIVYHDTDNSPMDFKIGDVIRFKHYSKSYKINDIHIRQLTDDTDVFKNGTDCANGLQGVKKKFLFSIVLTMSPAN
jgi:hypothetical protein